MKYRFHPEAEAELRAAIEYYEDCSTGLGHEFAVEVYSTIERICAFPCAWPLLEPGIRRALVPRFPYGVLYAVEAARIYILATMHLHRDPDYWQARKPTRPLARRAGASPQRRRRGRRSGGGGGV